MGGISSSIASTVFAGIAAAPGLLALSLFYGRSDLPIPQPLVSCEAPVHCECAQSASAASCAGFFVCAFLTFVAVRLFQVKKAPRSAGVPVIPRRRLSFE